MNVKQCIRCRRLLNIDKFYKCKRSKDGSRSYCKKCHYESGKKSKERYDKSPKGCEVRQEYMQRYHREVMKPRYIPKPRKTFEQRFWERVDKGNEDECWNWNGHVIKALREKIGYGRISLNGKPTLVHRASWILHNGDIPEGICVLHHCDNPKCVNPKHLWLGTQRDNMHDMMRKKRHYAHTRK